MSQLDDYEETAVVSRRPRHATRVPDEVGEDIHRRLAAMTVRSKCNRHQCTEPKGEPCTDPNHRRDNDSLLSIDARFPGMLDMLGLDHTYPAVSDTERRTWLTWIGQSGPAEDDLAA
jgi:hypothetical protein